MSNFFEDSGFSSVELFHSKIIKWIFNNPDILSNENKTKLLRDWFGHKRMGELCNFEAYTEYHSIDIIIKTNKRIFVIENKIKSTEREEQLKKYYNEISNSKSFLGNVKNELVHFGYLSLVEDSPSDSRWTPLSYDKLEKLLIKYLPKRAVKPQNPLFDYLKTVEKLVFAYHEFRNDHREFPNVFKDLGSSSYQKSIKMKKTPYSPTQKYIAENNLERPLHRYFLLTIAKRIGHSNFEWDESKQHLDLVLNEIVLKKLGTGKGFKGIHDKFYLAIRLKNRNVGFVFQSRNPDSNQSDIDKEIYQIFNSCLFSPHCSTLFLKFNMGSFRASCSLHGKFSEELYNLTDSDIDKEVKTFLSSGLQLSKDFCTGLSSKGYI